MENVRQLILNDSAILLISFQAYIFLIQYTVYPVAYSENC
jgi:hypothetical protein